MKKTAFKLLAIFFYMALFCVVTQFQMNILFDTKQMLLVLIGTVALSFTGYYKNVTIEEYRNTASYYATIVGYLTTFLYIFGNLYAMSEWDMSQIALNIRPLFYGFVLNILLKPETGKEVVVYKTEAEMQMEDMGRQNTSAMSDSEWEDQLRTYGLTAREREVALLIRNGYSNQEIADKLFISVATVKKHTSSIYEKLKISNREQLKVYF
ncbi:MAG: response regulator transcription factor [Lachnospiraceae bacterium]|nr:response regulator transcription factor [Lachnospiraceae bacterium]